MGDFFAEYGAAIGGGLLAIGALTVGVIGGIAFGGLVGSLVLGMGVGFFNGVTQNMLQQAQANGWKNMDFSAMLQSGTKELVIGMLSGMISFGFGLLGGMYGHLFGEAFVQFGTTFGTFVGGMFANEVLNRLYGRNPSYNKNKQEATTSAIIDYIIVFFRRSIFG